MIENSHVVIAEGNMGRISQSKIGNLGLLVRAAYFAGEKHRMQRRGDAEKTPYINHPLELAAILTEEAGVTDPDVLCGALLHDTIEDTETTPEELTQYFGDKIAALVVEVTNDMSLSSSDRRVYESNAIPGLSHGAKLIKLADKLANIRDVSTMPPMGWTREKKSDYFDFALSIAEKAQDASPQLFSIFVNDYEQLSIG